MAYFNIFWLFGPYFQNKTLLYALKSKNDFNAFVEILLILYNMTCSSNMCINP